MKKIYYILIAVVAVAFTSCKDGFLDKTPLDKLTEDAVFNSVGLAENHVNSMYSVLPDFLQEGNIGCITDEGYFRYGGTSTRYIAAGTMDPDNIVYLEEGGAAHNTRTTVLNIWNRSYKYLRDMNYFISKVEEGTQMDPADRDRLLGEVYFLRAWTYTNMIERYGGIPLIKKTFTMTDEFGIKRTPFDECVDEILQDLDKADELLPLKNGQGRANKVVAKALRSRLTLIAASPLFNDPDNPTGGIIRGAYSADKWTRAFNASKAAVEIAEANGFRLADTYDDIWKNVDCPENIWCKFLTPLGYTVHKGQLLYPPEHYSGWSSMEPTQAMVSDYELTNGKKWFEEGSGYDPKHPFENRDPRFYKTVAAPFKPFSYTKDGTMKTVNLELYLLFEKKTIDDFDKNKGATKMLDYTKKPLDLGEYPSTTFYKLHKWHDPAVQISEKETGSVLYPWIRLGEIYLNYAEAAFKAGHEDICREYINKIRDRKDVLMPHIPDSATGAILWDHLVNERRVELAFEAFRYFDVRRWKVADFYDNVDLYGGQVLVLTGGSKPDTVYCMPRLYDESKNNMVYYDEGQTYDYTWLGKTYKIDYGDCRKGVMPAKKYFPEDGRNYLMPIPRPEITKSKGSIEQNPGYN